MRTITSTLALELLAVGLRCADEISEPSCIAIVDSGGNIQAFARSDNATFGTAEIAITKAYTSAALRLASGDLAAEVSPGAEAYGLETSGRGRSFTAIGGGFPLMSDGICVGAIGVSGGPVAQDVIIAQAMLKAFSAA